MTQDATPAAPPRRTRRRLAVAIAAACVVLGAAVAAIMAVFYHRPAPEPPRSERDVPLGVEEAVIVRYAGPRLTARPYRRGASVNVRIADEVQRGPLRIYDVRYIVTLPGEFDLKEYLTSTDGSPLDDLPSFKVNGQTSLTKDIETRIREIEDMGIHIWHWYYETLAGLGACWVLWLGALIWIGRPKRIAESAPAAPEASLAEQIARYMAVLAQAGLSVAEKARLERLLLKHWREHLRLEQDRMAASCRRIQRDDALGRAYAALEAWLHDPSTQVGTAEILELCRPQAHGNGGSRGEGGSIQQ